MGKNFLETLQKKTHDCDIHMQSQKNTDPMVVNGMDILISEQPHKMKGMQTGGLRLNR